MVLAPACTMWGKGPGNEARSDRLLCRHIDLFHARIYGNVDDVIVGGVYVSHASWWDKSLGRR